MGAPKSCVRTPRAGDVCGERQTSRMVHLVFGVDLPQLCGWGSSRRERIMQQHPDPDQPRPPVQEPPQPQPIPPQPELPDDDDDDDDEDDGGQGHA